MQRIELIADRAWLLVFALCAVGFTSCSSDSVQPTELRIQAAKGGGGVATGPVVKSTNPASAQRNVTLDVRVIGSGFDNGSRVSFAINGVASTKVIANSTRYVSATELVANVTTAADADTVAYDVVVITLTGKKGIGSELFEIVGDPPTTWLMPLADAGLGLKSDGKYAVDGYSVYQNAVCGVHSKIFATPGGAESGDAIVQTDNTRYADRKCAAGYPRKVTLAYPDGTSETTVLRGNVHGVQNTLLSIPVGSTVKRGMNIGSSMNATRCGIIRFKAADVTGVLIPGDSVLVTRTDHGTWDVQTQPYPANRGNCRDTGESLHMNIRFRIVSAWALP